MCALNMAQMAFEAYPWEVSCSPKGPAPHPVHCPMCVHCTSPKWPLEPVHWGGGVMFSKRSWDIQSTALCVHCISPKFPLEPIHWGGGHVLQKDLGHLPYVYPVYLLSGLLSLSIGESMFLKRSWDIQSTCHIYVTTTQSDQAPSW